MVNLLAGRGEGSSRRARQRLGQFGELEEDAPSLGLEPAPLCVREAARRQLELGEVLEGSLRPREAFAETLGQRAEQRGLRARPHERQGIREQALARDGVSRGEQPAHERHGLLGAQGVPTRRRQDRVLIGVPQAGQRVRERGADAPSVDREPGLGREPAGEREAPSHPAGSATQLVRDRLRAQPVVVTQRRHDSRLVEDRESAPRCVGRQERGFGVERAAQALDHYGHMSRTGSTPALEPLEAVEQLIGPFFARPHAQGELGQARPSSLYPASPESRKARAKLLDRNPQDDGRSRERGVLGAERLRCAVWSRAFRGHFVELVSESCQGGARGARRGPPRARSPGSVPCLLAG